MSDMPDRIWAGIVPAGMGWAEVWTEESQDGKPGIPTGAFIEYTRTDAVGDVVVSRQKLREEFTKLTSGSVLYLPTFEDWLEYLVRDDPI